jgi:hypothetical protein
MPFGKRTRQGEQLVRLPTWRAANCRSDFDRLVIVEPEPLLALLRPGQKLVEDCGTLRRDGFFKAWGSIVLTGSLPRPRGFSRRAVPRAAAV